MRGVRVERDVGDDADVGYGGFERAAVTLSFALRQTAKVFVALV